MDKSRVIHWKFSLVAAILAWPCMGIPVVWATVEQEDTTHGFTNKSIHGNDEHSYYKHPGRGSFTGPFDYGTQGEEEPAPVRAPEPQKAPTGKCNCFTFDGTKSYSGN